MVTINQRLDFDQIELIAGEFGVPGGEGRGVRRGSEDERRADGTPRSSWSRVHPRDHMGTSTTARPRSSITSQSNVVAGESAESPSISARITSICRVASRSRSSTNAWHEAFTAMRARGAQVTDIVGARCRLGRPGDAADYRSISHAKNAGVR